MSHNTFFKIANYYNIKYDFSETLYNEAYALTIKLFRCFIAYETDELLRLYNDYKIMHEKYENSKGFIFCNLIETIYNLEVDDICDASNYINVCKEYVELYDNNIIYIYAMLWIFLKDIYADKNEIKEFILSIYNRYPLINIDPYILPMVYFQLGRINEVDNNIFEALNFYDNAINEYYKLNIYQRVIQANIQKGNCYFALKQYKMAKKVYFEMYEESKKYNYKIRMHICANNLAFIYFIQHDYEKAKEYIKLSRQNDSNFPDLYFYEAYIIYKTQSKKEARIGIKNIINSLDDTRVLHIVKFIRAMLNDNEIDIVKYFNFSKEDAIKNNSTMDLQLIYEMGIDYYKEHNKDMAFKLMSEYIEKFR